VDQTVLFNPFADWFGSAAPAPEGTALDLLTTVSRITVVRDPPSPLLKPSPIGVFLVPVPQANPKVLTLAPGRVLLASRQLAAGGPDAITGFDAASGTLTFQANVTVVSGVIHIPAAEVVQLDAVLETPPAADHCGSEGAGPRFEQSGAVGWTLPSRVPVRHKLPASGSGPGCKISARPDAGHPAEPALSGYRRYFKPRRAGAGESTAAAAPARARRTYPADGGGAQREPGLLRRSEYSGGIDDQPRHA
jgi:hypothetical protein